MKDMIKYFSLFMLVMATIYVKAQSREEKGQLIIDGTTRNFITFIPSLTNNNNKLPVIISLHGRFGTGKEMMHFADFRPLAERDKFIIICPDGIDHSWNAGRATPAEKKGINDVKFINELISFAIKTDNGDPDRIYVTGMSNGGFMSSRLACELNHRIAAIAVVGASMVKGMGYHPEKPIPVMYIQGTKDPLVPFAGGYQSHTKGSIYGHEEILKLWIAADGCSDKPVIIKIPDNAGDGTSIIIEQYINITTGTKVIGYTVTNGGHTWPGGTQYLPKFVIGSVSHNINACEVIWDFFKGYRLAD